MTCEHGLDREIVVCRQCESEETTAVERKLFLDLWDALPGHEATGDAAGSLRATLLLSAVGDEIRKTRLSADYFARYSANDFDPVTGIWKDSSGSGRDLVDERIVELTRERDAARNENFRILQTHMEQGQQLAAAQARIVELREALNSPFMVYIRDKHEATYKISDESDFPQHDSGIFLDAVAEALSAPDNTAALDRALAVEREHDIQQLVDRFLSWKLPKDFSPDCGIGFDGRKDDQWNRNKTWPIGTNLFSADQAREMFLYVIGVKG